MKQLFLEDVLEASRVPIQSMQGEGEGRRGGRAHGGWRAQERKRQREEEEKRAAGDAILDTWEVSNPLPVCAGGGGGGVGVNRVGERESERERERERESVCVCFGVCPCIKTSIKSSPIPAKWTLCLYGTFNSSSTYALSF